MLIFFSGCYSPKPKGNKTLEIIEVPLSKVEIKDDFWNGKITTNSNVTIPAVLNRFDENGYKDNYISAAGKSSSAHRGLPWSDSELYKVIEGIAYLNYHSDNKTLVNAGDTLIKSFGAAYQSNNDALQKAADSLIKLFEAAQDSNGYLHTFHMTRQSPEPWARKKPDHNWADIENMHELYCAGHLIEGAVAYYKTTGKKAFLEVAIKLANHINQTFGPGKLEIPPGHQEIELGLIQLYQVTQNPQYLNLAHYFLEERGNGKNHTLFIKTDKESGIKDRHYAQDHLPVSEQIEAKGHAVRALYMYIAMAKLQREIDSVNYLPTLEMAWKDLVEGKVSITGGVASVKRLESIAETNELPNLEAYNETCNAIAFLVFNHEMFLLTGDVKYPDLMERILYNGALSGISLDGKSFSYSNPLASDGKHKFNLNKSAERLDFEFVACCLSSLTRFIPSVPKYIYAQRGNEIFVNQFIGSELSFKNEKGTVKLKQETEFPWNGHAVITVTAETSQEFPIHIRIPGWLKNKPIIGGESIYHYTDSSQAKIELRVNGKVLNYNHEAAFITLNKKWETGDKIELIFPMEIRKIACDEKIVSNRGKIAMERGPLLYCLEGHDNPFNLLQMELKPEDQLNTSFNKKLLKGVQTISGKCYVDDNKTVNFLAIPYFSWSNRGAGSMQVWVNANQPSL
ncbi:glycoside hydrolase family 127 protein [Flexithrix dorotheae]|uniref:glycoside hydrolase family 127 protein n=1 Tax=Flexithrix dorotheae TaxID=70993 RepID=UPI0003A97DB1|nr:beta-L-arabinofuranosidase domain-containing protein [Flexithrix dorotheae]